MRRRPPKKKRTGPGGNGGGSATGAPGRGATRVDGERRRNSRQAGKEPYQLSASHGAARISPDGLSANKSPRRSFLVAAVRVASLRVIAEASQAGPRLEARPQRPASERCLLHVTPARRGHQSLQSPASYGLAAAPRTSSYPT